jgi:hypothetical protein
MVRNCLKTLDSGFRRNDGKWYEYDVPGQRKRSGANSHSGDGELRGNLEHPL